MNKETNKKNNLLKAGLVLGTLAAAAAGYLLYGPDGKKNRKRLSDWMTEAKDELIVQMRKAKAATKEEFGDVIDSVMVQYTATKNITINDAQEFKDDLLENWDYLALMIMKGNYKEAEDLIVTTFKTKAFSTGKRLIENLTESAKDSTARKPKKSVKKTTIKSTTKKPEKK